MKGQCSCHEVSCFMTLQTHLKLLFKKCPAFFTEKSLHVVKGCDSQHWSALLLVPLARTTTPTRGISTIFGAAGLNRSHINLLSVQAPADGSLIMEMSNPEDTPRSFAFLKLPPEIRRMIYSLIFQTRSFIPIGSRRYIFRYSKPWASFTPQLIFVCHQIYGEATPVLYEQNIFDITPNLPHVRRLFIGISSLQMVKHLRVDVNNLTQEYILKLWGDNLSYVGQVESVKFNISQPCWIRIVRVLEVLCWLLGSSDYPNLVKTVVKETDGYIRYYRILSGSARLEEDVSGF